MATHIQRYCKVHFPFLPSREDEIMKQYHTVILSITLLLPHMSLESNMKKMWGKNQNLCSRCVGLLGAFWGKCVVTYTMYVANNLEAEGRIVVRTKIEQWKYRAISVKFVILLN